MDLRCLVVFQGGTSLPEDRFINTLHFQGPAADIEDNVAGLQGPILNFYEAPVPPPNAAIGNMLPPFVARAYELRFYDLATPTPRVPFVVPGTLPASGGEGFPEEVSLVLSFTGAPPVTGRRRGRIYIGPIGTSFGTGSTSTTPARPSAPAIQVMTGAAARLRTEITSLGAGFDWVIRSSVPTENFVSIVRGWVDNAWDTQRRRGPDPSSRVLWGPPL